ncbi:MAG: branched-chain amino acid aminotransferase [Chitinophagaceae bacterium]|nr:branched-chain amino acid aminotransferase [Chitinophagaceae bacterium]
MELMEDIIIRKVKHSRIDEVDFDKLEFGKYVSDHMLVCDYVQGEWQTAHIIPFGNLSMSPTTLALHYGQAVFEGMKALHMHDGRVNIFRTEKHYERLLKTLHRMCMPVLPKEIFVKGLRQLVELDAAWVPSQEGSALYIRPFMYASEARFGVKVSDEYRFIIFTGPVGPVFSKPIRVKVETDYARAVKGGTGFAKCAGNYGGAFYPTQLARQQGFDQVLWTDAIEHKYIEESGMMNVMFVIDKTIVTPALSDSILDGVTRDSLLTVAGELGIKTAERKISIQELKHAFETGLITEAFGAGTAAVVSPIQTINMDGADFNLPAYHKDSVMYRLRDKLEAIRTGKDEDKYGWNDVI